MADTDANKADTLVQACFDGKLRTVRALVESGVALDAMVQGWNPLHAAIENMQAEVVSFLLQAGADSEFICRGARPIHHAIDIEVDSAAQANAPEAAPVLTELLLLAGVDTNAIDEQGRTPLQLAVERGHWRAADVLRGNRSSRRNRRCT